MALTKAQAEGAMDLFVAAFENCKVDRDRKRIFNDFKDTFGNGIGDWSGKCRKKLEEIADDDVLLCYDALTGNMALKTDLENVVVRRLMEEDLDQAQEIMNRALGMCMTHFDNDKFDQYLESEFSAVACQGDNVLGVILAGEMPDIHTHTVYVDIFAVSENVRGYGVGHKLMEYVKDLARSKGKMKLHQIKLQTQRHIEAYKIYKHWGFDEVDSYVQMRTYIL